MAVLLSRRTSTLRLLRFAFQPCRRAAVPKSSLDMHLIFHGFPPPLGCDARDARFWGKQRGSEASQVAGVSGAEREGLDRDPGDCRGMLLFRRNNDSVRGFLQPMQLLAAF